MSLLLRDSIDKNGSIVFDSRYMSEWLGKKAPFFMFGFPVYIELNKLAFRDKLKQSNYNIEAQIIDVVPFYNNKGEKLIYQNAIDVMKTNINFIEPNFRIGYFLEIKTFQDYLQAKFFMVIDYISKCKKSPGVIEDIINLKSKDLNTILSWNNSFNIYNSPELIDQLVVNTLFYFSRNTVNKAGDTATIILFNLIKDYVKINVGNKYENEIKDDILHLVMESIKDSPELKSRFKFELNPQQSFSHFMLGDRSNSKWKAKINEFQRERMKKFQRDSIDKKSETIKINDSGDERDEGRRVEFSDNYKSVETNISNLNLSLIEDVLQKVEKKKKYIDIFHCCYRDGLTYEKIGEKFNISKGRVSQIIKKLEFKIKEEIKS